jgi:hypothetical protein
MLQTARRATALDLLAHPWLSGLPNPSALMMTPGRLEFMEGEFPGVSGGPEVYIADDGDDYDNEFEDVIEELDPAVRRRLEIEALKAGVDTLFGAPKPGSGKASAGSVPAPPPLPPVHQRTQQYPPHDDIGQLADSSGVWDVDGSYADEAVAVGADDHVFSAKQIAMAMFGNDAALPFDEASLSRNACCCACL